MSKTAQDLITTSLRKIGAIATGETPTASEIQDGLDSLSGMLDVWSLNDLLPVSETEETFSLQSDKQDYTIGSGGDFDTTRPIDILGINLIDGDLEYQLRRLTFEQWKNTGLKSTQSNLPSEFYFKTAWPLSKISLYPVPNTVKSVKIYSRKPLISLTSESDEMDLPPYYINAIIFNLCIEIADDYGRPISAAIAQKASDTLSAIKAQNLSNNIGYLKSDIGCGSANASWSKSDFLKRGDS